MVPDLSPYPGECRAQIDRILADCASRLLGIVGSSLGGYYAAYASGRTQRPAALINPVAYPTRLFSANLGVHRNLYTGERFEIRPEHLQQVLEFENRMRCEPGQLSLYLQTGDETLDYREALERYRGAAAWIQPGGSHAFERFDTILNSVLGFFQSHCQQEEEPCLRKPV